MTPKKDEDPQYEGIESDKYLEAFHLSVARVAASYLVS